MPLIDYSFEPDPLRADALDRRMHAELASSISHVCSEAEKVWEFDASGVRRLAKALSEGQRFSPFTFADYYDLVMAIVEDRDVEALRLFSRLCSATPVATGMRVDVLGSSELGQTTRIINMMNADPALELGFCIPSPDVATAFRERLDEGFDLLDRAFPELGGEIRAIVRHLIIAGSDPTKKYQFDGGSHFQLWGALFLNANFHPDAIAVAEVLAHECAHSLLFGFCTELPLVDNADDELYESPLRVDKRPMDGIFHATFVSARMHLAMSRIACACSLSEEERTRAINAAAADLKNFYNGYSVVEQHARLTEVGAGLMANAKAYMDSIR